VLDVSAKVIDRATELRARHGFKSPDAIHLATALVRGGGVLDGGCCVVAVH
jgi:predicted nucleic acid-binding protein